MNEKQYHSLNKNQVLWNSIELFYCHPCLAFHEICYIEADKKYNIENKLPNNGVQNKSTSVKKY